MWIFTRYGFFSISACDKRKLAVRTRTKKHLVMLQNRLPFLKEYPILESPKSDYPYRIYVPRNVWVDAMLTLTVEQHWPNVKKECQRFSKDKVYESAMADVWARMIDAGVDWEAEEEEEHAESTLRK